MDYDYINLIPNNWFLLQQTIATKLQPFSLDTFKIELEKQINDPTKMEIIELSFGKKYPKHKIETIEFYIDNYKFEKMIKLAENESRHPMITFHGTSLSSIKSILENGYKIPISRTNKLTNNTVVVKNGAMYGYGVYTSPFLDKAMYYTVPENENYVYMIVNFLVLGKTKLIAPNSQETSNLSPINNVYPGNIKTNIVFGLEQIISADNNNVIPIAVLKIRLK